MNETMSSAKLVTLAIVLTFIAIVTAAFVSEDSDFSDDDRSSYSHSDSDYDVVWVHDSSGSYQKRVYHPSRAISRQSSGSSWKSSRSSTTQRSSSGSNVSQKSSISSGSRSNSNTSSGSRSSTSSGGSRK